MYQQPIYTSFGSELIENDLMEIVINVAQRPYRHQLIGYGALVKRKNGDICHMNGVGPGKPVDVYYQGIWDIIGQCSIMLAPRINIYVDDLMINIDYLNHNLMDLLKDRPIVGQYGAISDENISEYKITFCSSNSAHDWKGTSALDTCSYLAKVAECFGHSTTEPCWPEINQGLNWSFLYK